MSNSVLAAAAAAILLSISSFSGSSSGPTPAVEQPQPAEKHLSNIRQLTHGGENAEAYFSADGKRLVFQSTREGVPCDQIFTINIDGTGERRVSNGKGRTTCGFF